MRIGVFFESLPKEEGGGFTFQETILEGLPAMDGGHEFVIFHYGASPKAKLPTNMRYQSLGGSGLSRPIKRAVRRALTPARALQFKSNRLKGESSTLLALSPLDKATREAKIDLLWFPTPMMEKVDCPFVTTIWDLEHRAQPFFPEVSANGEWERRQRYFGEMLPRASYVITGTAVGKGEIERFFGVAPERIRILPHPTPAFALAAGNDQGTRPKSLPEGDFLFYPAQFWAHKNHLTLVRVIAELRKSGVEMRLALVGSDKGNRTHVEMEAKKLGVQELVHFLGFVPREELIYLYRSGFALVYPSLCGPENLPPLEAFALGCPVLAADIAGSREQLGSYAKLLPPLEPEAWAKAIRALKQDGGERSLLAARGRERAAAYTAGHFLADVGGIFNEYSRIRELWGNS
jgi:glycosyltransferase involved in cell wall biosynthesis